MEAVSKRNEMIPSLESSQTGTSFLSSMPSLSMSSGSLPPRKRLLANLKQNGRLPENSSSCDPQFPVSGSLQTSTSSEWPKSRIVKDSLNDTIKDTLSPPKKRTHPPMVASSCLEKSPERASPAPSTSPCPSPLLNHHKNVAAARAYAAEASQRAELLREKFKEKAAVAAAAFVKAKAALEAVEAIARIESVGHRGGPDAETASDRNESIGSVAERAGGEVSHRKEPIHSCWGGKGERGERGGGDRGERGERGGMDRGSKHERSGRSEARADRNFVDRVKRLKKVGENGTEPCGKGVGMKKVLEPSNGFGHTGSNGWTPD